MSNILHMQQTILDIQERVNREIQFGEDTQRELLTTVRLMRDTLGHLENQINQLFNERAAALVSVIGHPSRPQTVDMTAEQPPLERPKAPKKVPQPAETE